VLQSGGSTNATPGRQLIFPISDFTKTPTSFGGLCITLLAALQHVIYSCWLNSHLPFIERVANLDMTPEQLDGQAEVRKEATRVNSKNAYERERENDLEGHLSDRGSGRRR
jgi:hypothetical protein